MLRYKSTTLFLFLLMFLLMFLLLFLLCADLWGFSIGRPHRLCTSSLVSLSEALATRQGATTKEWVHHPGTHRDRLHVPAAARSFTERGARKGAMMHVVDPGQSCNGFSANLASRAKDMHRQGTHRDRLHVPAASRSFTERGARNGAMMPVVDPGQSCNDFSANLASRAKDMRRKQLQNITPILPTNLHGKSFFKVRRSCNLLIVGRAHRG